MSETTTYKLGSPITREDGSQITELTLRKPLAGDYRIASREAQSDFEHALFTMREVTGITTDDLDRMEWDDMVAVLGNLGLGTSAGTTTSK